MPTFYKSREVLLIWGKFQSLFPATIAPYNFFSSSSPFFYCLSSNTTFPPFILASYGSCLYNQLTVWFGFFFVTSVVCGCFSVDSVPRRRLETVFVFVSTSFHLICLVTLMFVYQMSSSKEEKRPHLSKFLNLFSLLVLLCRLAIISLACEHLFISSYQNLYRFGKIFEFYI